MFSRAQRRRAGAAQGLRAVPCCGGESALTRRIQCGPSRQGICRWEIGASIAPRVFPEQRTPKRVKSTPPIVSRISFARFETASPTPGRRTSLSCRGDGSRRLRP